MGCGFPARSLKSDARPSAIPDEPPKLSKPMRQILLGHCADEAHSARKTIEFGRDESVVGEDQIGPNDADQIAAKAILPRELDDVLGFSLIEILSNERGRRAAHAAHVECVERTIEGEQIIAERFQRMRRRRREAERLGRDTPCYTFVVAIGDAEEASG